MAEEENNNPEPENAQPEQPAEQSGDNRALDTIKKLWPWILDSLPLIVGILALTVGIALFAYFFSASQGEASPNQNTNCASWSGAPTGYQDMITKAANAAGIQPALLGAVFLSENSDAWGSKPVTSTDWPKSTGPVGDGPFQIPPQTWPDDWKLVTKAGFNNNQSDSQANRNDFFTSALAAAFELKGGFDGVKPPLPDNSSDQKAIVFVGLWYNRTPSIAQQWATAGYNLDVPIANQKNSGWEWGATSEASGGVGYAKRLWNHFQDLNIGCAVNTPNVGSSFIQACQNGTSTTTACKIAGAALTTAVEIKSNVCPDGLGCWHAYSQYANNYSKSVYSRYAGNNFKLFTDCGRFVGYIVRQQYDKSFPAGSTSEQYDYVINATKTGKYKILSNNGSNVQPGDILFEGSCNADDNAGNVNIDDLDANCQYGTSRSGFGHIVIYVGDNSLFPGLKFAEASLEASKHNGHGPRMDNGSGPETLGVIARPIK